MQSHSKIQSEVQRFYECHPYPDYPFAASPRFQAGVWANPRFARWLAVGAPKRLRVFIAGAGAILPAVIGNWLLPRDELIVNDLSARSLRRAKFAMKVRHLASNLWLCEDLERSLKRFSVGSMDHIDFFGVLHHLDDPKKILSLATQKLATDGTMRVMVYHRWGRVLPSEVRSLLKDLSPFSKADVREARLRVIGLSRVTPWEDFFRAIGTRWQHSDADFVDRFMHPHEVHWEISKWGRVFESLGLEVVSLMDRYHELQKFDNPLATPPSFAELDHLAEAGQYSGNLEVVLKKRSPPVCQTVLASPRWYERFYIQSLKFLPPPPVWSELGGVNKLSFVQARKIWCNHLDAVYLQRSPVYKVKLDPQTEETLSRLGAILKRNSLSI